MQETSDSPNFIITVRKIAAKLIIGTSIAVFIGGIWYIGCAYYLTNEVPNSHVVLDGLGREVYPASDFIYTFMRVRYWIDFKTWFLDILIFLSSLVGSFGLILLASRVDPEK